MNNILQFKNLNQCQYSLVDKVFYTFVKSTFLKRSGYRNDELGSVGRNVDLVYNVMSSRTQFNPCTTLVGVKKSMHFGI